MTDPHPLSAVLDTAAVHSTSYFLLTAKSLFLVQGRMTYPQPYFIEKLHLGTLPLVLTINRASRYAWPQHTVSQMPAAPGRDLAIGAALAGVTLGSIWALEGALGWLHWGGWGWQHYPPRQVLRSVLLMLAGHTAVAINEETIFRGHGLSVLTQATSPAVAAGVTTLLFVGIHGQVHPAMALAAYGPFALNCILLRQLSGGLPLPLAYHWTWNVAQTALVGARKGEPALIEVISDGPQLWTGRHGESVPGLLMVLVQAILTILLGWLSYRRRRRASVEG